MPPPALLLPLGGGVAVAVLAGGAWLLWRRGNTRIYRIRPMNPARRGQIS